MKQGVRVSWLLLTKARQFPGKCVCGGGIFSGSKVLLWSTSLFPCTKEGVRVLHSGSGSQVFAIVLTL